MKKRILWILGIWTIVDVVNLGWLAHRAKKAAQKKERVKFVYCPGGTLAVTTPDGSVKWFPSRIEEQANSIAWMTNGMAR